MANIFSLENRKAFRSKTISSGVKLIVSCQWLVVSNHPEYADSLTTRHSQTETSYFA